jgi:hypothetical protein
LFTIATVTVPEVTALTTGVMNAPEVEIVTIGATVNLEAGKAIATVAELPEAIAVEGPEPVNPDIAKGNLVKLLFRSAAVSTSPIDQDFVADILFS